MKRCTLALVVAGLVLAAAGVAVAEMDKEKLAKLMKAAHEGKTSPLGKVKQGLQEEKPDWNALQKEAAVLLGMGKELVKAKELSRAALAYKDAADALTASIGKQQKTEAAAAFKRLAQTCAGCHYGGKPVP